MFSELKREGASVNKESCEWFTVYRTCGTDNRDVRGDSLRRGKEELFQRIYEGKSLERKQVITDFCYVFVSVWLGSKPLLFDVTSPRCYHGSSGHDSRNCESPRI